MRRRDDVVLRPRGPDASGILTSDIVSGGADTPLIVVGEELGGVVEVESGCLVLFVIYGDPYEDSLEIYLVDPSWRVLDRATLAAMGATGRFEALDLRPPARISFAFYAGRPWTLTLFERPRWSVPWPSLGLSRPARWRRWFALAPAGR